VEVSLQEKIVSLHFITPSLWFAEVLFYCRKIPSKVIEIPFRFVEVSLQKREVVFYTDYQSNPIAIG